mmetsp:Transcript_9950/g.11544  ORF Transcript_9950/g.11544 Transcript_9950/m.11544 type:complete len:252 (+) Transcript_9950:104-859(+)|eukprot:CAMPEP_0197861642 /NCGR_PEP_ID=MMETSP1438-20131217/37826_1 /TAXON_ID=1461541 /ORGANISM="Pterosperma sp., Strain CCMP1384" /LENGTH=251 /DNA_ID=CAMNT_0043478883 /DNA_START=100 /DNA_END=855 /DNA_ORIENTATION=+
MFSTVSTRCLQVVLLFALCCTVQSQKDHKPDKSTKPYQVGDNVKIECKDWKTGKWGKGPVCKETEEELKLSFGVDSFNYCGLDFKDEETFKNVVAIAKLEKTWQCRIPMGPDSDFYVPFTIPIWAVVEDGEDHLHMNTHLNTILHVESGKIIAVAMYPARDRFQFGNVGTVLGMHGPVRWFHRHGFESLSGDTLDMYKGGGRLEDPHVAHRSAYTAAACSLLTFLLSLLLFAVLYQRRLKPRLISKCLKRR